MAGSEAPETAAGATSQESTSKVSTSKVSTSPELTPQELRTLVALAKRALWSSRQTRRQLQDAGVNVTPANFYSSVPLIADLESSFEFREAESGVAPYASSLFDPERVAAFAERVQVFADEFDPPRAGDLQQPAGFFWGNPAFSYMDAMSYYCILRALRPRRVLEIGSGFSTLVADQALRANGDGELVLVEPYPKPFLRTLPTLARLIETPVQAMAVEDIVALVESAQVWFIDSTHTVKAGSDCLYIYLKVMPRVRTPVLCHSHDVYLPYAMPKVLGLDRQVYWTEQYLLLAYLLDNPKAQVVAGSHYLQRALPQLSRRWMRGRHADGGASLWYQLNAPDAAG